ncbi:restriction endonuclease subunit S [Sedimenticola hydrogenitrophicus]|uniref:restriction endonuclease subunit S n=1 Tax=Sedimenticola hydrogenitrophicus TaxID=2967975 RepID=UPI0021A69B46|nr:restriction endonuclease subunit S [Sedimenticola hydrogenitrophicus]
MPHPDYQESRIEWIGQYPKDWKITRVKFESYVKARVGWHGLKSDDFTDEGPYLVTGSDFRGPLISWEECYHCDLDRYEQDPYIQLKEKDLLITKDGTIGKVALVSGLDGKATLNSGVFVVRPLADNYTSKFYFWLLQSSVFTGFVDFNKTGSTIVHLYQDTFVNFRYALPSFHEQLAINDFLSHETVKIDTLIEKQQQLIKLLKEKRQAVISHAVTKGLNPDAPMRDSGVEWLGEVPEHWEVKQLQHLVEQGRRIMYGIVLPGPNVDVGVPIVKGGDVKPGRLNPNSLCKTTFEIESCYERSRLKEGDLVYSIRGTIGDVEIVPKEIEGANLTQDAARIAPAKGVNNLWLKYTLESTQVFSQLEVGSAGAAVKGVNICDLKKAYIPVPPENEMTKLSDHIERLLSKMDKLSVDCDRQIKLLQERRTALISAAVTGKIDVRSWVAPEQIQNHKEAAA